MKSLALRMFSPALVVLLVAGGTPAHAQSDADGDGFDDLVEDYIGTDPLDDCPNVIGTPALCPGPTCDGHDAWPLDNNVDTFVTVVGDVLSYARFGGCGGPPPDPNWLQRLDLNADNCITVVGDVLPFSGMIGAGCT